MDNVSVTENQPDLVTRFGRWACFMVMATAGMIVMGMSILAEPMAGYYADQATIEAHKKRLEDLRQFNDQLGELLQNANQPGVVERAAINNLRYVPEEALTAKREKLPKLTPAMEKALAKVTRLPEPKKDSTCQFFDTLAAHPIEQGLLLILGSGLVVVSLTFFNRQS